MASTGHSHSEEKHGGEKTVDGGVGKANHGGAKVLRVPEGTVIADQQRVLSLHVRLSNVEGLQPLGSDGDERPDIDGVAAKGRLRALPPENPNQVDSTAAGRFAH